jgi:hypothetical protein
MQDIFLTVEVLKVFKFKELNALQLENIYPISVTDEVSKLLKFNDIKE